MLYEHLRVLPLPRQCRAVLVVGDWQIGVTGRQCVCALKSWGWGKDCIALFNLSLYLPPVSFATETLFCVGKHEAGIPFWSSMSPSKVSSASWCCSFGFTEWHNGSLVVELPVVWDTAVLIPWHWAQPSPQLCWKPSPKMTLTETHYSCHFQNFWNFSSRFINYCFINKGNVFPVNLADHFSATCFSISYHRPPMDRWVVF